MDILIIAGPCAIESEKQALSIAESVYISGADMFRGGLFKTRTNPNSFQGIGTAGAGILDRVRGFMPVISEATQVDEVGILESVVDVLQIGSRNMHSTALLKACGESGLPVMVKRGYAARIFDEWIKAAEYVKAAGCENILMCERGIRTFERYTRNTLDLGAIGAIREYTKYPIIVDPSHSAGKRELVIPFALAAIAAGADGLIIEVHNDPGSALCDGEQSITTKEFRKAVPLLRTIASLCRNGGRKDAKKGICFPNNYS